MAIPVLSLCLVDTVVIYPPDDGQGTSGGPVQADGTSVTLVCSVQNEASEGNRSERFDGVVGEADFNLVFAAGTSLPTGPGWRIQWTKHNGTDLASPVEFISLSAATPPGGLKSRWTVPVAHVTA